MCRQIRTDHEKIEKWRALDVKIQTYVKQQKEIDEALPEVVSDIENFSKCIFLRLTLTLFPGPR
jgi:hypothetical protein